jgi:tRNA A-37 threonylcarbamoyl transferase component Bud32
VRSRAALVVLALTTLSGCGPDRAETIARPAPELRWYRDLAIADVGGDQPAMHADPGGGVWVAVPGVSTTEGRSRLFYRPPGGAWSTRYEGPFATELNLSSVRAGEVYLGASLVFEGYRPTLRAVSATSVRELAAPSVRLDPLEWLQVGAYAMLSDDEGFACGQHGSFSHLVEGRWTPLPPVFPWKPGDDERRSFCTAIRFEKRDRGTMVDVYGNGATWDGTAWRLVPREAGLTLLSASGLAQIGRALVRLDERGVTPIAGELPGGGELVADAPGRWVAGAEGIVAVEGDALRALRGHLPFTPTAIAEADGALWALARDGVYRSTRRQVPTFVPAAARAIPAGLAYAIAVDLDGDGDEDLLGLSARSSEGGNAGAALVAELNDGAGHFTATSMGLPDEVRLWRDCVDAGDVDGDGDVDVVLVTVDNRVELWSHVGAHFERSWSREAPGARVTLVDLDGDGDLDLSLIPGAPALLVNDGAGRFGDGPAIPALDIPIERAAWADADGDGRADAVLQHWRNPAHLLLNTANGFVIANLPVVAEGASWADLDLDGRPELYAQKLHVRGPALPFERCAIDPAIREHPAAADRACLPYEGPPVPAGLVVDLDLDGKKDVISTDLRGDEIMTGDGEVHLATGDASGFERITAITGAMPRPVVLDANGDGDPDVYTTAAGLFLDTADPPSFLRVRPRASRSDRLARGASVIVRRAGDSAIVATGRADLGSVTLGLPDPGARYDVEVRFPAGERRTASGVAPGTSLVVRDADAAAYRARLASLWILGTARRAWLPRDLGLPILGLALLAARRRRAAIPGIRAGIAAFLGAYVILAGPLLRAGGALAWTLSPAAAGLGVGAAATALAIARSRARRRAGPYTLLEKLGAGAAATVWRARAGKTIVALKLFSAESMGASESRERFFREARIGGEIRHPNVVRIHDSGALEDGRCYLAMELVPGRSLGEVIRAEGKLAPERAAALARDVAAALAALHDAGVVHRDVKPENILVRPDGAAVLTDLGLARSALFKTLTRQDVAVGTLAYMSPEQCVGRPLDGRSDLWSLGVVLHEMLTGERPFTAEHELELVYVIHNIDPPPPSSREPAVPAALDAVVKRCLARAREDRFASAQELGRALDHGRSPSLPADPPEKSAG